MLKKLLLIGILSLLFSFQLIAQDLKNLSLKELNTIRELYIIKKAEINIKNAYDAGSVIILDATFRGQPQSIYLTKDKKILMSGTVLNTNTGETISLPADMSITNGKEALTFGSGDDEYILFSDMECMYCKKFESFFPKLEKFVKIKVFFYPLDYHKYAKDLSIFVMNQPTNKQKIEAFLNTTKDTPAFINRKISEEKYKELNQKINQYIEIARALNVAGTPTVFDKNGKKVAWTSILDKYGIELK